MKQILTYVSPKNRFNAEHEMLVKIQIDNSIGLGWTPKNILLVTNFDYQYKDVTSIVISDDHYCKHHWTATKINVIIEALKRSLIDELTWYHDFDCYQLSPFREIESDMGDADVGLAQYGRMPRLCSASMFIKPGSLEFFEAVKKDSDYNRYNEEYSIMRICGYDEKTKSYPTKFNVKKIDITYALHRHNFNHVYARAKKPIMAAHFHPTSDKYDIFVKGNNRVKKGIIPKRLIKIFHEHGFNESISHRQDC
jgi:hypothetical protein